MYFFFMFPIGDQMEKVGIIITHPHPPNVFHFSSLGSFNLFSLKSLAKLASASPLAAHSPNSRGKVPGCDGQMLDARH